MYIGTDIKLPISLLGIILLFSACGPKGEGEANNKEFSIVATTGMLGDAIEQIVGNTAEVISLMGPGVDPHLYKASFSDLGLLENADVVVYNGLHLEGKMGKILEKLSKQKTVIVAAEGLAEGELLQVGLTGSALDPHIWFDVALWREVVLFLGETLAQVNDEHASAYRLNAKAYADSLSKLHRWVDSIIASIPQERRVLITAHDAFGYFGRAYKIEVRGLQGISTVSEFGLKDVRDLADFIVQRNIKAVFVESSIPERSLEAVVSGVKERGGELRIGGTLYSDAMGEAGTTEGTYIGMVEHNVETIEEGLR